MEGEDYCGLGREGGGDVDGKFYVCGVGADVGRYFFRVDF